MKVLFLLNAWVHDGPGALFRHLLPRLAARPALDIEAAALRSETGPLRDDLEAAGIPCRRFKARPGDFLGARAIRRALDKEGFDIIVTSLPRPDLAGTLAAKGLDDVEVVSVDHGPHAWREKGFLGKAGALLRRRTLGRVRTIACVSEAVRWELFRSGVQGEKLRIIHNGVDPEAFRPAAEGERAASREEFGLPADALVIGCAGSMRPVPGGGGLIKGQDTLLEALGRLLDGEELSEEVRGRLVLAFAGGGPEEKSLRKQAAPLGDKVRLLGPVPADAMPRFWRALDIAAQPSRVESFGLALAEAMASGLPCAAADVGGVPEIMREKIGPTVPPGDPEALAQALALLAGQGEEERAERGKAAREHAARNFSIEACAANWAELLENIPRQRLARGAHLEAARSAEEAQKSGADAVAQEIAASAHRFAEEYDKDEKAEERQEDLAGRLKKGGPSQ